METKEYIITSESSQELITEAAKALWTNTLDSSASFNTMSTMTLDNNVTTRVITLNNVTVTVTEDAYVAFADAYFTEKANAEINAWNEMATNKLEAEQLSAQMWEEAGFEWPNEIIDYRINNAE